MPRGFEGQAQEGAHHPLHQDSKAVTPASKRTYLQFWQLLVIVPHDLDNLRDGLVGHQLLLHTTDKDADSAGTHKLGGNCLDLLGPGGAASHTSVESVYV